MSKRAAVILAAGEGRRMHSNKAKALHEVLFTPMSDRILRALRGAGVKDVAIVTGHLTEQIAEKYAGTDIEIYHQGEQLGTAHALSQAMPFIEMHRDYNILVISGDTPLITSETLEAAYELHVAEKAAITVLSGENRNPTGYGRIVRGGTGGVVAIVEEKDASPDISRIIEINSGIYWFSAEFLSWALPLIENKNAQGEYYLTDAVSIAVGDGRRTMAYRIPDSSELLGVNTMEQLLQANGAARKRVIDRLIGQGVVFNDLSGITISEEAEIGADTMILKGTIIRGNARIGSNCIIGPDVMIDSCDVGDDCVINASQLSGSTVGSGAKIGPYAQLRPGTVLGNDVKVGNFVEVKNSVIGNNTSIAHLSYIGDTDCGERVNIGCGTVTVNYDGRGKYRTTIGNDVFVGCNTNLIAPVTVEDNSYIAAGSTITERVEKNSLAIARARQINKEDWVTKRGGVK